MFSWWPIFTVMIAIVMVFFTILILRRYYSPVKRTKRPMDQGNIPIPEKRSIKWEQRSELTDKIMNEWSSMTIPSWKREGKVKAPRVLLAKLHEGKDIKGVNRYISGLRRWGEVGSTWLLNRKGDYDFTMVPFISILYLFGQDDKVLDNKNREHIVDQLIGGWKRFFWSESMRSSRSHFSIR